MAGALSNAAPRQLQQAEQTPATDWRGSRAGYLFLTPWLIGFFGLTLGPALVSLYLSFTDFDLLGTPRWVGAANYVQIGRAHV